MAVATPAASTVTVTRTPAPPAAGYTAYLVVVLAAPPRRIRLPVAVPFVRVSAFTCMSLAPVAGAVAGALVAAASRR